MNYDCSKYELIDNQNALFHLDFDFKNYDLVLSRDDLRSLENLDLEDMDNIAAEQYENI